MTATPPRIRPVIPAVLSFLLSLAVSAPARATIQYAVSLDHPEKHLFQVTMTIPNVADEVTVQMAAWNTLYQIRDFSSHVQQVEAFAENGKAPVEKIDKQTWRIKGQGFIQVRYATYWDSRHHLGVVFRVAATA